MQLAATARGLSLCVKSIRKKIINFLGFACEFTSEPGRDLWFPGSGPCQASEAYVNFFRRTWIFCVRTVKIALVIFSGVIGSTENFCHFRRIGPKSISDGRAGTKIWGDYFFHVIPNRNRCFCFWRGASCVFIFQIAKNLYFFLASFTFTLSDWTRECKKL